MTAQDELSKRVKETVGWLRLGIVGQHEFADLADLLLQLERARLGLLKHAQHNSECELLKPAPWCRAIQSEHSGGIYALSHEERMAIEAQRECTCGLAEIAEAPLTPVKTDPQKES